MMTAINVVIQIIPQVMNHGTSVPTVCAVVLGGIRVRPKIKVMAATPRTAMPLRIQASVFRFMDA